MDYSLPGSSVHGIFQARILEWVAISFSRGSSQPRDWTRVSHIVGRCLTIWATREAHEVSWKYRISGLAPHYDSNSAFLTLTLTLAHAHIIVWELPKDIQRSGKRRSEDLGADSPFNPFWHVTLEMASSDSQLPHLNSGNDTSHFLFSGLVGQNQWNLNVKVFWKLQRAPQK